MTAADWIAEQRRIEQAATEGPWRAAVVAQYVDDDGRERGKGGIYPAGPSGPPPLFVTPDWVTADAELIADARTALPKALDALEAVLALHRRVGIYDGCECDDKNTPEHEDIYEIGVTCNKVYEICAACCRDDVYQSEECVNYHQHDTGEHYCPSGTVVAIAEALGVEP